jgi:tRNA-specific 2-thiouridylase
MKPLLAIAVSGGIDSLVAAYLLKKQGYNIVGIHFTTGYESQPCIDKEKKIFTSNTHNALPNETRVDSHNTISNISNQLGIDVKHIDCSTEFKHQIVDYFTHTYQIGQTPNPCMVCNPLIKFGTVFDFALKLGASSLATGHYARIREGKGGKFHLLKGVDSTKDQSYFLALMSQERLARACFPLGNMTKSQVFHLANQKRLEPVKKRESQDICFIRGKTYGDFLATQVGFKEKPGLIEDVNGNILGRHKGLHLFTIGQRRGIDCPAAEPYYVAGIDSEQNRLIVGFKNDLATGACKIEDINWIIKKPNTAINVFTRVRYRHEAAPSRLIPTNDNTAIIQFDKPQSAIAPGQCAVFYQGDEVLGGGWISPERM